MLEKSKIVFRARLDQYEGFEYQEMFEIFVDKFGHPGEHNIQRDELGNVIHFRYDKDHLIQPVKNQKSWGVEYVLEFKEGDKHIIKQPKGGVSFVTLDKISFLLMAEFTLDRYSLVLKNYSWYGFEEEPQDLSY